MVKWFVNFNNSWNEEKMFWADIIRSIHCNIGFCQLCMWQQGGNTSSWQREANHLYNKIPILIFCRNQIDEEAKLCLSAGACDVFFEPADRTLVLNRIQNVVNLIDAANILAEIEKDVS